jgi:hypothetical protein
VLDDDGAQLLHLLQQQRPLKVKFYRLATWTLGHLVPHALDHKPAQPATAAEAGCQHMTAAASTYPHFNKL